MICAAITPQIIQDLLGVELWVGASGGSADRAARGRQAVVAVAPDGDAEAVAAAVGPGGQRLAGAGHGGLPAVLQGLAAVESDGGRAGAGAAYREVHVEPVAPGLAGADADRAAATATTSARRTGRGGQVVVAVAPDRDAEVVAAAVRRRGEGLPAAGHGGLPARLQRLATV